MPTTKAPIMGDNPIIAAIPAAAKKDAVTIPSTAPSDLQLLREHHLLWLFLPALHDIIHQREKRVALHYSVRLDVIRKTSKLWIHWMGCSFPSFRTIWWTFIAWNTFIRIDARRGIG